MRQVFAIAAIIGVSNKFTHSFTISTWQRKTTQTLSSSILKKHLSSHPRARLHPLYYSRNSSDDEYDDDDDDDEEPLLPSTDDWRAFRAQLVGKEQQLMGGSTNPQEPDDDIIPQRRRARPQKIKDGPSPSSGWAYDAGDAIEKGTIILHRPPTPNEPDNFGYSLGKQYLHKSVIFILGVEGQNGPVQGIILNRPTDIVLDDEWNIWYGGNIHSIRSMAQKYYCLHSMSSPKALKVSREVIPGIQFTSISAAMRLVEEGHATPNDFWTFCGITQWDSMEELLEERRDGDWRAIATDSETVKKGLNILSSRGDPHDGGVRAWKMLTEMIEDKNEGDRQPRRVKMGMGLTSFDDLMLREWARENLVYSEELESMLFPELGEEAKKNKKTKNNDENAHNPLYEMRPHEKAFEGTIIRGSSALRSPFLLSDQEFHKSLVLIIQDNDDMTVGVILNHPSSRTIDFEFGPPRREFGPPRREFGPPRREFGPSGRDDFDEEWHNGPPGRDDFDEEWHNGPPQPRRTEAMKKPYDGIALRYGGPMQLVDDNDQPLPHLFLHKRSMLRYANVGEPFREEDWGSGIWKCTEEQVVDAIVRNVAVLEDFMAVSGFCVWKKEKDETGEVVGGGIEAELEAGRFEVVDANRSEEIWNWLMSQELLDETTIDRNIRVSNEAWACGEKSSNRGFYGRERPGRNIVEADGFVYNSRMSVSKLCDDALKMWMRAILADK